MSSSECKPHSGDARARERATRSRTQTRRRVQRRLRMRPIGGTRSWQRRPGLLAYRWYPSIDTASRGARRYIDGATIAVMCVLRPIMLRSGTGSTRRSSTRRLGLQSLGVSKRALRGSATRRRTLRTPREQRAHNSESDAYSAYLTLSGHIAQSRPMSHIECRIA